MRVLFAGTPVFAQAALNAIVAAGHQVLLVLTRADQPVGRAFFLFHELRRLRGACRSPAWLQVPSAARRFALCFFHDLHPLS